MIRIIFDLENWLWMSKFCNFLTTFIQVTARLKFFSIGLLLDLHIKEGLVECAKVCNKSVVILLRFQGGSFYGPMVRYKDLLASLRKCIEGPTQLRSYRDIRYSSNEMRKAKNEQLIIVCWKFDRCVDVVEMGTSSSADCWWSTHKLPLHQRRGSDEAAARFCEGHQLNQPTR